MYLTDSGFLNISTEYARLWYNGITSALQAEDAGSTPVGR